MKNQHIFVIVRHGQPTRRLLGPSPAIYYRDRCTFVLRLALVFVLVVMFILGGAAEQYCQDSRRKGTGGTLCQ
jgi:hypothetical protein